MGKKCSKKNDIKLPKHFWTGITLVLICWFLNWTLTGMRTHLLFFPMWLGYSLVVDAIVYTRKGSSLLTRNFKSFLVLFVISIPLWWIFEILNCRVQNWHYTGKNYFTDFEYILFASLNFSTVIPAVFETAELTSTFKWLNRLRKGIKIAPSKTTMVVFFVTGWLMLALLLICPKYFYPFLWISGYFILEPINTWRNNPTLIRHTGIGDWRPVFSLWIGCLICGFFWEMWNFYSDPKWIYNIPFVNFMHIFEMPILGYLGYLPFSLELFAVYHLIVGRKKESGQNYVRIYPI